MDINLVLAGIGAGITYSLTAYAKKEGQKFDYAKFGTTIIIGALAGLGTSLMNVDISTAHAYLINLGIVPIVENGLKTLYRKVIKG